MCRPSSRCCKPKPDLPKALHVTGPRPMTPLCVRPSSRVFLQGPRQPHDANALGHITHTRTHRHDLTKPTRPRCQEDTGSAATLTGLRAANRVCPCTAGAPPRSHDTASFRPPGTSRVSTRTALGPTNTCTHAHGPSAALPSHWCSGMPTPPKHDHHACHGSAMFRPPRTSRASISPCPPHRHDRSRSAAVP